MEIQEMWEIKWTKKHWDYIKSKSLDGTLSKLLAVIPQSKWNTANAHQETLLHYACIGDNEAAIFLLLSVVSANKTSLVNGAEWFPINAAADFLKTRNIELMLAAGFKKPNGCGHFESPLYSSYFHRDFKSMELLVSNGYRLRHEQFDLARGSVFLKRLEKGVVQCRNVIVVLLGLKKRRVILPKLDRFLVQQELTVAIWTTRTSETWQ